MVKHDGKAIIRGATDVRKDRRVRGMSTASQQTGVDNGSRPGRSTRSEIARTSESVRSESRWSLPERRDNGAVIRLADSVLLDLMATGMTDNNVCNVRAMIKDYNLKVFLRDGLEEVQYEDWCERIRQCCSIDQKVIPEFLEQLILMARDLTDDDVYPPVLTQSSARICLGHGLYFPHKEKLYKYFIRVLRQQPVGVRLSHFTQEYAFLKALLSKHPDADQFLDKLHDMEIALDHNNIRFLKIHYLVPKNRPPTGPYCGDRDYIGGESDELVSESRLISISRCMDMIQDPVLDPARYKLVNLLYTFYTSYQPDLSASLFVDLIRRNAPCPFFQYRSEKAAIRVKYTVDLLVNYMRCIIELMKLCRLNPVRCAASGRDGSVRGERRGSRQAGDDVSSMDEGGDIDTVVSRESLESYSLYRGLQSWLFDYLHQIEFERPEIEVAEENIDIDEYNLWLKEQADEFSRLLIQKKNQLTTRQIRDARQLLTDESVLKRKYLELRTEEEIGPVKYKLDQVLTLTLNFFQQEFLRLQDMKIKQSHLRSIYPYDQLIFDEQSGRVRVRSLGIVRQTHKGVEGNDIVNTKYFNASQFWFHHVLQDFRDCCLGQHESPLIPLLIFSLIHCSDNIYNDVSLEFLHLLRSIYVMSKENGGLVNTSPGVHGGGCSDLSNQDHQLITVKQQTRNRDAHNGGGSATGQTPPSSSDDDVGRTTNLREKCVRFLVSFGERSQYISVMTIEDILSFLAVSLLKEIRRGVTDENILLCATLFSGCLEILIARWSDISDEAETRRLIRLMCLLAFSDEVTNDGLISKLRCLVAKTAAEKFSMTFDFSYSPPLVGFIKKLVAKGKGLLEQSTITNKSLFALEGEWPIRPFDRTYLREFGPRICKSGWLDCWALVHPNHSLDPPLEIGRTMWSEEWNAISGGAYVVFSARRHADDQASSTSSQSDDTAIDDREIDTDLLVQPNAEDERSETKENSDDPEVSSSDDFAAELTSTHAVSDAGLSEENVKQGLDLEFAAINDRSFAPISHTCAPPESSGHGPTALDSIAAKLVACVMESNTVLMSALLAGAR